MRPWGLVSGGVEQEASPVKRDEQSPGSRRFFILAEWLVLRMDKTCPSLSPLPRSSYLYYGWLRVVAGFLSLGVTDSQAL